MTKSFRRLRQTLQGPTQDCVRVRLRSSLIPFFTICFALASAGEESWYVVLLSDERAGYVRQTEERADGNITTAIEMRIEVGRGDAVIKLEMDSEFVESVEGEPVSAESSLNLGGTPIVTAMAFHPDTIDVTATQGDTVSKQTIPAPAVEWMPPAAAARHVEAELARNAETITVTTLDPAMGIAPFSSTLTIVGEEDLEVFGRVVPAKVWEARVSTLPGIVMREYVDEAGRSLKSTVAVMPGLELTVIEADKDLALSPLTPPEMMAATLIKPTGLAIKNPRQLRSATYELRTVDGEGTEAITTPVQHAAPHNPALPAPQAYHVDLTDPRPARAPNADKFLDVSTVLNHEDPAVVELRDNALSELRTSAPPKVAETLRRFVRKTIRTKDLSVGFATASEVARTKQGDCTEHAVLLAALLRSADIPARGVSGLVYVDEFLGQDGVFGYHMWTQAWLDPDGDAGPAEARWVDLDATLDADTPFDATHIALAINDLNGHTPVNDMVQLVPLLGNLRIEVLSVSHE